jgi:hypothetical protein
VIYFYRTCMAVAVWLLTKAIGYRLPNCIIALILCQSAAYSQPTAPTHSDGAAGIVSPKEATDARAPDRSDANADNVMSADAREVAELTGIFTLHERLLAEQKRMPVPKSGDPLQDIRMHQKIIYLHEQISQYYQTTDSDWHSVVARLDSELSKLNDLKIMVSDEHARAQHRTTFTNLFSGGVTKIGGYTTALTKTSAIPTNVLEVFDGTVQMALSSLMLRQEGRERKMSRLFPETLLSFLSSGDRIPKAYPSSVWEYLNHPLPGRQDGKNRRQLVIDAWIGMGRVIANTGRANTAATSGSLRPSPAAENNIEITMAMMSDIKAVLSGMETSMAELSRTLKSSYAKDPEL